VWFGKIMDVIRVVRPAACVAKVVIATEPNFDELAADAVI
jgi:hypothetical protein